MAYSLRFLRLLLALASVATILMILLASYKVLKASESHLSLQQHDSGPDHIPTDNSAEGYLISDSSVRPFDISSRSCNMVSKWVVTTSSTRTPPEALRVILKSTEDWCVLVLGTVADLNYDFSWTNGTTKHIYLPREALALLPYKLATLTSFDVKNIGYLYAIANGARVVLDLEYGIVPIPIGRTYLPLQADKKEYPCPSLEEKEGGVIWNPYPHFGGGDMWPRGFPQSSYAQPDTPIGSTSCYPIIQQYLSQSHPDVDASYLMNNKKYQGFKNLAASALVIPRGVFAPYNSHSTIHLYEALWSLLLPKTVHKRVADIWRSYIAQSLFYLIPDACLMFTPPAVTGHITESPSYGDELPLYTNSSHVANLLKYHLMSFDTFEEALLGIYELMYQSQILGKDDVTLVQKYWISDLKLVGYEFPKLPKKANLWTKNVHLCIMFNWGSTEYRTRILLSYYMRFFDSITLFIEGERASRAYIPSHIQVFQVKTENGILQQKSLELCINEAAPNTVSHLYIADDMFINITKMSQLSLSKIWYIPLSVHTFGDISTFRDRWNWWDYSYDGLSQYERFVMVVKRLPVDFKQVMINKIGFPNRIHGHAVADIVHVPNNYSGIMTKVLKHINSVTELFCEIAVPLAVDIAQPIGREEMEDGNLWEWERTETPLVQSFVETRYYVHAMKLSTRYGADIWCKSMNNQLRLLDGL